MPKILIAEDDAEAREMVALYLGRDYQVEAVANGRDALHALKHWQYDLLILDWNMPEYTGLDICKQYRLGGGQAPVLFLTGNNTFPDKEQGFTAGADDYMTKPFDLRELNLRVQALLRRHKAIGEEVFTHGDLTMDCKKKTLLRQGTEISLSPREFQLLELFMRHPNETFSAEAIARRLWSNDSDATALNTRVQIKRLRDRIDLPERPSYIKNTQGHGYGLCP